MADYRAIADVGRTLLRLFRENMSPDPVARPELIGLAPPTDKGDLALSLFLYQVVPNHMVQQGYMVNRGNRQQFPPLAVDLYFMMTAHSQAEISTRALDEYQILGRAIQLLHDNAQVDGSLLQGSLADESEGLKIILDEQMEMREVTSFFAGGAGYKLSFSFLVGPVFIDSMRGKEIGRVTKRDTKFV